MKIETAYYRIHPYPRLLYIESHLAWDEKVAVRFINDVGKIVVKNYMNTKWAVLHDASVWQLGTPAAEGLIADFVTRNLTDTLSHHALVVGTSEIAKWQAEKMFQNVVNYRSKLFKTRIDAEDWLAAAGYTRDSQA